MRLSAVLLAVILVSSPFLSLTGTVVKDAEAGSVSSWTRVFHLHDSAIYTVHPYDWMNSTASSIPSNWDYDNDGLDGISIRKNIPPQRWHHWILYPPVNRDVVLAGDISASLWARSRGNDSATLINAIIFDAGPGEWGDPALWTEIGRNEVPLNGPFYADFQFYTITISGVSYTLPSGHSIVLTVQRGDSHNDWLIVMYDRSSMDSYVTLRTTTFVSVDNATTQDSVGVPRNTFSDLEDPVLAANLSDPFGAYDIVGATASVAYSGNGTVVVNPFWMTLVQTDVSGNPSWKRFQSTLPRLQAGQYLINVTASDRQGSPSWLTITMTIVTADHFEVEAPTAAVAGEYFMMNVTAVDATNAVVSNWVGTVQLDAFADNMTWPATGVLSNSTLVFNLADLGRITNMSQSYDRGDETIRIRATDGLHIGWSDSLSIRPGPIVNISIYPGGQENITAGSQRQFEAVGIDIHGNVNTSWEPFWQLSGGIGTITPSGANVFNITFNASSVGTGSLMCTDNNTGLNDSVLIVVQVGTLYRIVISSPTNPLMINEAESQALSATGYDINGNSVDISGATWDTSTTGTVSGSGIAATYTAGFIPETGVVRCRVGNVIGTIDVVVQNAADGPWLSEIPAQIRNEDSGTWDLSLTSYWHDVNGTSKLMWWVENVNTTLYFVSHDPASNAIMEFYTQKDQSGEDTFKLWVVDETGFRAFSVVTVRILPVNDPPLFVNEPPGTLYVKFDTSYLFDYTYYVMDVDNDKSDLTMTSVFTVDSTPVPSIFFNGVIATFLLPKENGEESYFKFVTLRVTDQIDMSSFDMIVWVTRDTPPELNDSLPDKTVMEGTVHEWLFDLDNYFYDSDKDTLYFTNGFQHVFFEVNQTTHDVYISALEEWSGTTEGIFMATDPTGALKVDTVAITVTPVNDPPEVKAIDDVQVKYNSVCHLYLGPYVSDPDNSLDSLTYTISDPHVTHSVSMTGAHRLDILFPPSLTGPIYTGPYLVGVTLTVTDPDGNSSLPRTFNVLVTDNSPPEVISENAQQLIYSFAEDTWLNDTIRITDLFSDPDDTQYDLTLTITGYLNIHPIIYPSGVVNLTAAINWSGMEVLTIKAVDPHGAWASVLAYVTVTEVDDAPVVYQIPDLIIKGGPRNFRMVISHYIYDSDPTSLKVECSPSNAIYVGDFLYISLPDNADVITVTLWVSEGPLESNKVDFKVGVSKTMAEKIGWPYSFPLVLLASGVAAFFAASRIPRPYALENLFLIHNDGRLVAHVSKDDAMNLDKDVVSAMFTAVQEFVKDSFQKGEVGLKKLEIGDSNVVIEKGASAYLALIYSGWPQKDVFDMLTMILRDIEERYKDRLGHWNGTMKTVSGVDKMLQEYMAGVYKPGTWHEEEKIAEQEWVDILSKET